jgi:hypothetical protein
MEFYSEYVERVFFYPDQIDMIKPASEPVDVFKKERFAI